MTKQLIILGAGTAGTIIANRLRRGLSRDWSITIVDRSEKHIYQPGLLFIPFGMNTESQIVRATRDFLPRNVNFVLDEVESIQADNNSVELKSGQTLNYDMLIVATGCRIAPEETEGMLGAEWHKSIFDFYTLDGACKLRDRLANWTGGKLVVHINEMPIKCPVAPLEFTFLADSFFKRRGLRDKVSITFVTPLSGAFTKPEAARTLGHLLGDKGIALVTDFAAEKIDAQQHKLVCYDGREVEYDLLVTTPTNMGDLAIRKSNLGDDLDFIATHKNTLQSSRHPNVFVLGDATNLPTSKAGSVAHFESETLVDNVLRYIAGQPLKEEFDGHANCFIESGDGKALLIDFNYSIDPHAGRFPFFFGPMSLLKESRLNHWGKLAFRLIYWHMLLPARWIPGISRNKTVMPKTPHTGK